MATIMRVGGGAGGKAEGKNPAVSTLAEESVLLVLEDGVPTEYYISKHGYQPELNNNRTLLTRKVLWGKSAFNSAGNNGYSESTVDQLLNGEIYNSYSSAMKELIGTTKFKYTPGNGNFTVSTMERAVFLLALTEYNVSSYYNKDEGEAVPIATKLWSAALADGTSTPQLTRSPSTANNTNINVVNSDGSVNYNYGPTAELGVRPNITIPSDTRVIGPDNYGRYSLEVETVSDVYGIARDITAQSPVWTRTDGAMTFSAKASVGTVAGASDFDNIYPWSEMKRVTLDTGDVMVRIPKFYYGRYRNGNIERIQISGRADVGLTLHPAFNHGGVEQECIYVGAYKCGIDKSNNSAWKGLSKSGEAPMVAGTRTQFRLWAQAKGSGWALLDISTLSAIQMLYLVEFANNNSQAMIGRGHTDGSASPLKTGTCDAVIGLTGRSAGTDGLTDIVYRGIEGIWGNTWEWVDGINIGNRDQYFSNDPSKYIDGDINDSYAYTSYQTASWSASYITRLGCDPQHPHIMLPEAASGGSESTHFCDSVWGNSWGWKVYAHGGLPGAGASGGLFCVHMQFKSTDTNTTISSRLIYIPQ